GKIFIFGGIQMGGGPVDDMYSYDLRARVWNRASSVPQSVCYPATAALAGRVYVAGGCVRCDCSHPTSAFNAYDPKTDVWTSLPPLPEPVYATVGAALGGRFFVFGGVPGAIHGSGASPRVYAFDPASRAWSRLRDMPRPRTHGAGAELGGRFILAGGCTSTTPGRVCEEITGGVDSYDDGSDAWSPAPALPTAVYGIGAAADGERIIVAGGTPANGVPAGARTFTLDRGASRWAEGPPLNRPRNFAWMFRLPQGVGLFGSNPGNTYEDLVEALGAPGPFIDPGEPPQRAPAPAESPARPRTAVAVRAPAPALDAESPEQLPSAAAPRPHAHAIVIGVERYREALPRADFAAGDAKLTAEYFRRVLGVPEENLVLLSDDRATKSDFEKYFERWLPNRVEKGDEVYVYFSGHGAPNPKTGEAYLVPFDADPTYIEQTGYPIKKMYEVLAKLPAERVLLVMDSCFSGAGGRSVIAQGARPLVSVVQREVPRGLTVISASAGDQISNSYQEKRHGLFTYFFLKGLKEKGLDFRAVYDYLKPQVTRVARRRYNSDQEPQWRKGR
ncbi:MAG: hypothetical protein COV48_14795, partial [Elusimicrobia bacterium CG11_big_fil_rev_8_21_14_0_20_64_6]